VNRSSFVERIAVVAMILVIVFAGTSYIKNLVKFTKCDFKAPYKAEVIYGAGLFVPTFLVTGWINIEE